MGSEQQDILQLLLKHAPLVREIARDSLDVTEDSDGDALWQLVANLSYTPEQLRAWGDARGVLMQPGARNLDMVLEHMRSWEVADFLKDEALCNVISQEVACEVKKLVQDATWSSPVGTRIKASLLGMREEFIFDVLSHVWPFGRLVSTCPPELQRHVVLSRLARRSRFEILGERLPPEATAVVIETLGSILNSGQSLEVVDISACGCGDYGAQEFIKLLFKMDTTTWKPFIELRELDLSCNGLTASSARALFSALRNLLMARKQGVQGAAGLPLRSLKLHGNELGNEGAKHLAAVLPCFPHLQTLEVCSCGISGTQLTALLAAGVQHCALTSLHLDSNPMGTGGMQLEAMQMERAMRHWHLEGLRAEVVTAAGADAAPKQPPPTSTGPSEDDAAKAGGSRSDAQASGGGEAGAAEGAARGGSGASCATAKVADVAGFDQIAKVLEHSCVQQLGMAQLQLSPVELAACFEPLGRSSAPLPITHLDLSNNCVVTEAAAQGAEQLSAAADALTAAMHRMPRLCFLDLSGIQFVLKDLMALSGALAIMVDLKVLVLRNTHLTDTGAAVVCGALPHLEKLEKLDVAHNQLGYEGALQLVAPLARRDTTKQILLVGNTNLDSKAIQAVSARLPGSLLSMRSSGLCFVSKGFEREASQRRKQAQFPVEPGYDDNLDTGFEEGSYIGMLGAGKDDPDRLPFDLYIDGGDDVLSG